MRSSEFEAMMRRSEAACNAVIPSGWIVTRIDGRGFSRLTKETVPFERPFDLRFHQMMTATVRHLMNCGFSVIWAYTQSDEISLLHRIDESTFSRRLQKYTSLLAGEAAAVFSLKLGLPASFDCRVSVFASAEDVTDYFRWRLADAERNAVGAWCYWSLRKDGADAIQATKILHGMSQPDRLKLIAEAGMPIEKMPLWQRCGTGFRFEELTEQACNPITGEEVAVSRRVLSDFDVGPDPEDFILTLSGVMQAHVRPARRGGGLVGR